MKKIPNSHLGEYINELPPQVKNGLKFAGFVLVALIVWFLFLYFAVFMLPLTLALIISQLLEPLVKLFMRIPHVSRKTAASVSGLLALLIIGLVTFAIGANTVDQTAKLIENLPGIVNQGRVMYENFVGSLDAFLGSFAKKLNLPEINLINIEPSTFSSLNSLLSSLGTTAFSSAKTIALNVVSYATLIPKMILFTVVFVVATLLMMRERDDISAFFRQQFPTTWLDKVISVRGDLILALLAYIRAQFILMLIVFMIMFLGFTIMQLDYSLIFALVIGVFDALPIFGAGLFLIPSALVTLFTGQFGMALGFTLLYVMTIIVRQTFEPRLVSQKIGINPLVTLAAMYAGFKLQGILGLLFGAITVMVLKNFILAILNGKTLKEYLADAPAGSNAARADAPAAEPSPEPDESGNGEV